MKVLQFLSCFLLFVGCSPSVPEETAPASAPTGNAALIRNPIAAELPEDSVAAARITFVEREYHFGEVRQGDVVTHTFDFTNTGSLPLLITDARSTCGCTVPDYPRAPVPPGASGRIEVAFNTAHKYGLQRKPVTITANTLPAQTTVFVQGTVLTE
jgi:hypothetical protein